MYRLVAGILICVCANSAHADDDYFSTSAKLLEQCSVAVAGMDGASGVSDSAAMGCLNYVAGFRDGIAIASQGESAICIPAGVTNGQLARVFAKWGHEHPELLHEHKALGLTRAVAAAFPC
jgi:hypothetical protein